MLYSDGTNALIAQVVTPPTQEEIVAGFDAKIQDLERQAQSIADRYDNELRAVRVQIETFEEARAEVVGSAEVPTEEVQG